MTRDPIFGMTEDETQALRAERDRKTFYFCSEHCRKTFRDRGNLIFAFVDNALGIPVAPGVLYPFFGLLLSPIIAGAAMTLSSVSVISNALRLRNVKL